MSPEKTNNNDTQVNQEGIQLGLADRSEAMNAITQARANLGEVAAKPVVTASGEVMTPGDMQAELKARAEQGPSYRQ